MVEPLTNIQAEKAPYKVLLYYKLHPIENPEQFTQEHKEFCQKHNLKGRIIIAKEGINGTCCGTVKDIDAYMNYVHSLPGFEDLWFKQQYIPAPTMRRLSVRLRKEVVTLGIDGLEKYPGGVHLTPQQVNEMFERSKTDDSIVFFDMRSKIEAEVGRFPNAIVPDIRFFRELPQELKKYENLKDKKIVMYCTGGIRCEKASRLFQKEGFNNVYEVDGGVYNYCTQYPDGNFQGTCYVFDDRMQLVFDQNSKVELPDQVHQDKIISHCAFCNKKSARVVNDERKTGRVLVVCCEDCDKKHDISRVRYKKKTPPLQEPKKTYIGKGQHYYPKPKVAQIIVEEGQLKPGDELLIQGPTTGTVKVKVNDFKIDQRNDIVAQAGDIVTFRSDVIVRPSDRIYKVVGQ